MHFQVFWSGERWGRVFGEHQPDCHHPSRREPDQPDRSQPQRDGSVRRGWKLSQSLGSAKVSRRRHLNRQQCCLLIMYERLFVLILAFSVYFVLWKVVVDVSTSIKIKNILMQCDV